MPLDATTIRAGQIQVEFWERAKVVGVGAAVREMAEALARCEARDK